MAELKPCKCGSKNWCVWACYSPNPNTVGYYVDCDDCMESTDVYKTEVEAIEAWNRRAKDD